MRSSHIFVRVGAVRHLVLVATSCQVCLPEDLSKGSWQRNMFTCIILELYWEALWRTTKYGITHNGLVCCSLQSLYSSTKSKHIIQFTKITSWVNQTKFSTITNESRGAQALPQRTHIMRLIKVSRYWRDSLVPSELVRLVKMSRSFALTRNREGLGA